MLYIRLIGAVQTGKTQLAQELAAALTGAGQHDVRFEIQDSTPLSATSAVHGARGPTLLMGLDLAASPAAIFSQQSADEALRKALAQAGIAYHVVYGRGPLRLQSALQAVRAWQPIVVNGASPSPAAPPGDCPAAWVWSCETCSDPRCERRLLSDLVAAR